MYYAMYSVTFRSVRIRHVIYEKAPTVWFVLTKNVSSDLDKSNFTHLICSYSWNYILLYINQQVIF